MNFHEHVNADGEVLILKRIPKNRITNGGGKAADLLWPGVGGRVECDHWDQQPVCGGGLHGWPWGFGLGDGMEYDVAGDVWLVLGADPQDVVGNVGDGAKCKVRAATIRWEGTFTDAMHFVASGFRTCIELWASQHASGDYAQIGSSGNAAKIGSSGYYAKIGSSGYAAQIGSSGNAAKIGSSGNSAKIGSSGNSAKIGSSGDSAKIGSSGDAAQIGSSGHSAQIGSSGDYAQIGSSGDYAKIGSSGNSAKIGSSGDYAKIDAIGKDSIVAIAAHNGRVRVGERGTFAIAYWDNTTGWEFIVGKVGRDILSNTWYTVENGKLVIQQEPA